MLNLLIEYTSRTRHCLGQMTNVPPFKHAPIVRNAEYTPRSHPCAPKEHLIRPYAALHRRALPARRHSSQPPLAHAAQLHHALLHSPHTWNDVSRR